MMDYDQTFIMNGVLCRHPRGQHGVYINQIEPLRYASLWERFVWLLTRRAPAIPREEVK